MMCVLPMSAVTMVFSHQVGEPSHGAVEVLIQHVALQVPDRAEFRQKASLSILGLMRKLPDDVFRRVIFWFCRWAHSEKLAHRQFSIEVRTKFQKYFHVTHP